MHPAVTHHEQQILRLLQTPDQTQGDLLQNSDCRNYAELNSALQDLQRKELIEFHFPDGVLRYRLKPPPDPPDREHSKFFWQRQ